MTPPPPVRRVLLTADAHGGVATHALALARALARRGVATTLALLGGAPPATLARAAAAVPGLRLVAHPGRLEWMADAWEDVAASGAWLEALARQEGVDVVQVHSFGHVERRWCAPVVLAVHSCVTTWWRAVHGADPPASWDRYRAVATRALVCADAVVTPSRALAAALQAAYGVRRAIRAVPNGLDPRPPATQRRRARRRWALAAGRLWDLAKGLDTVLAAAPRLPWPVALAGPLAPPPGAGGLTPPLPPGVRALGPLPWGRLRRWFARARVLLAPSRYEPFGLVALEAAQAGCALVLGDHAAQREIWGPCALYVPPGRPDALAAAAARLQADPRAVRRLARAARRRAQRYTADRMARGYLALYAQLRGTTPCAS